MKKYVKAAKSNVTALQIISINLSRTIEQQKVISFEIIISISFRVLKFRMSTRIGIHAIF